jgi:glycosyltransferase involved in cell wall biosynthesis
MRILAFPLRDVVTGNPYTSLLYGHMCGPGLVAEEFTFSKAAFSGANVVHLHWPDAHLRSMSWRRSLFKHVRLAVTLGYLRLRGCRVVWTLHNLKPHEQEHPLGRRLFEWWFPRMVTHAIALTALGKQLALERYPVLRSKPLSIIPHGHYRSVFPERKPRQPSRAKFGLPEETFVYGFFGAIRPYKQVPKLIESFSRTKERDGMLLVAGKTSDEELQAAVTTVAAHDARVVLRQGLVPDNEVGDFFGAVDLVVLPFSDILNSGSVLLALSLNCPVLAPRLGSLIELQETVGKQWLKLYEGELDAAILEEARSEMLASARPPKADLSSLEWSGISEATLDLYKTTT